MKRLTGRNTPGIGLPGEVDDALVHAATRPAWAVDCEERGQALADPLGQLGECGTATLVRSPLPGRAADRSDPAHAAEWDEPVSVR